MKNMNGKSQDILHDNIEQLKELFPEAVTEGKIDFEVLRELLGEKIEDDQEYYRFTWKGKSQARREALKVSTGTLRPCREESVDFDNTENLYIEGDNLEVLKLLQKSYHNKVKMIYIDPPYNTGNDFVYKDDYKDNLQNYLEISGQVDKEGMKQSTNTETSGRYHSNWLNMMYPRLILARKLLREDGVIFISIDDNEVYNLRKICDEIFGENNFIANIIWQRAFAPISLKKTFSESHDYIICYSKEIEKIDFLGLKRSDIANARYKNPDKDPRGVWQSDNLSVGPVIKEKVYEIITPGGRKVLPPHGRCWVLTKERFEEFVTDNRIWFGENGNNTPRIKRFLTEVGDKMTPMTLWLRADVGDTQEARRELKQIFSGKAYFDYPKPVKLMKRMLEVITKSNDLILDFFSGSSTTAQAVMELNREDEGSRKFIMVQLQEATDIESEAYIAGYKTISDIGKERIKRVIHKIREEDGVMSANMDLGFKVLMLDSSNVIAWDPQPENLEAQLELMIDNIKPDRSEDDLLYEVILKSGLELTAKVEELELSGKRVFNIGKGALIVCLAENIGIETVKGIGSLKEEIAPVVCRVVFRDNGFADDVVKTNALQELKRYGIEEVRSI